MGIDNLKYLAALTISVMANGDGVLRERLVDAYTREFIHVMHELDSADQDVPEELQQRALDLQATLTAIPSSELGSVAASVAAMLDDEVRQAARQLYEVASALSSL